MASQLQLPAAVCKDSLPSPYGKGKASSGDGSDRNSTSVLEAASNVSRRPSAEYNPSKWSHEYIKSLKLNRAAEGYREKMKLLEESVRNQLISVEDDAVDGGHHLRRKLQQIDAILKLGLRYRFQKDIMERMRLPENCVRVNGDDLYTTALCFRLARQNGLRTSQDVFKCHLEKNGRFDPTFCEDVQGLLALYEASYLAVDGEEILDEARVFSTLHLRNHLEAGNLDEKVADQVKRALELPLHRRVQMLEARWLIEGHYNYTHVKDEMNMPLLELARLNYNLVQTQLQTDIQELSRWWKDMGLANKLSFARDRLMECFFWATALLSEPQFSNCRKGLTKLGILTTIIDDVYDVYGSLDELELFTHCVLRWDLDRINDLPEYLKLCFLALYNTINQIAYDVLKEKGVNVIHLLAKAWAELCIAFLVEARWFHSKQMPSFDDYLNNGCVSASVPLILLHAYCLSQPITSQSLQSFLDLKDFMRWPSVILRLTNDLVTYSAELARGESVSSIVCYMHETGVSEDEACGHMRDLIKKSWKRMNCLLTEDLFSMSFVEIVMNLGRIVHCVYQHGDGHGAPDKTLKERVMSLIINPISSPQV